MNVQNAFRLFLIAIAWFQQLRSKTFITIDDMQKCPKLQTKNDRKWANRVTQIQLCKPRRVKTKKITN